MHVVEKDAQRIAHDENRARVVQGGAHDDGDEAEAAEQEADRVHAHRDEEVLADDPHRVPGEAVGRREQHRVVAGDRDVRRLHRDVRARLAEGSNCAYSAVLPVFDVYMIAFILI